MKKPAGGQLPEQQKVADKAYNSKRAIGERGNSLLETKSEVLRCGSLFP
ncbi:hypothetical protein ACL02S_05610 [Nocardia sp. 004]